MKTDRKLQAFLNLLTASGHTLEELNAYAGYAAAPVRDETQPKGDQPKSEPRARTRNTNTNTNTILNDGRLLDLTQTEPPAWLSKLIAEALQARGIAADLAGQAWANFAEWNVQRKGRKRIELRALLGWLPVWRPARPRTPKQPHTAAKQPSRPQTPAKPLSDAQTALQGLVMRAPSKNRDYHAADLMRKIGREAYEAAVDAMAARFGCARFSAVLAVHGDAVGRGLISP